MLVGGERGVHVGGWLGRCWVGGERGVHVGGWLGRWRVGLDDVE